MTEAGCEVAVELEGPIAHVTERHDLVPGGPEPALAAYGWTLALGAVVDGFTVTSGGRTEPGVLVPDESLAQRTPDELGLAPDLGVLRIASGAREGLVVEAQVYPVAPGRVTGFTVRWSAPAVYADGVMRLTLPARGRSALHSRCRVLVDARPASGVRGWTGVRVAGVWIGDGARVRGAAAGAAADSALTIEARPIWSSGAAPVVAAAYATAGDAVVASIGVYLPDKAIRTKFAPSRLLFVVDVSRSLGAGGRKAAADLVESLGRAAPPGTPVEAILFARESRRALGTWIGADVGGVARIARAIREAPEQGGTELTTALRLASDVIGEDDAQVIVVTDGMLPVDHTSAALLGHFPVTTAKVTVDVVVPLVDNAAAPDRGALEVLTSTFHGRVVAFPSDRPMPASALTESLAAALPISNVAITADGEDLELDDLPDDFVGGAGALVTTELARRPKKLVLSAERAGATVKANAIAFPASAARFAKDIGADYAWVVIDRRAKGGAQRFDLAVRLGLYTFSAPPEELRPNDLGSTAYGRTYKTHTIGELPAMSVRQALRDQLAPRLRVCYRDALRADPELAGELSIELEIARGEVMAVNLSGDHFPEAMIGCVATAGYALTTPTYELGGLPDVVYVVRKPVTFEAPPSATEEPGVFLDDVLYGGVVSPGAPPPVEVSPDSPL
ncbi:MAG TPA: VWA domain-containing protein [Kofleriaceae bacterium]|nr:VWA domain-containing protein [Kofleriaceae bacterium]